MTRLRTLGPRVYLKLDVESLQERVAATPNRGIASEADKTFQEIFDERTPLYEKYSDFVGRGCPGQSGHIMSINATGETHSCTHEANGYGSVFEKPIAEIYQQKERNAN